jgi:serine/threonine protein kinase
MGISRKKMVDGPVASPASFSVVKLLGRGDVGKVYLVSSKSNGRIYAMKVLSKNEMIRRNKVTLCFCNGAFVGPEFGSDFHIPPSLFFVL